MHPAPGCRRQQPPLARSQRTTTSRRLTASRQRARPNLRAELLTQADATAADGRRSGVAGIEVRQYSEPNRSPQPRPACRRTCSTSAIGEIARSWSWSRQELSDVVGRDPCFPSGSCKPDLSRHPPSASRRPPTRDPRGPPADPPRAPHPPRAPLRTRGSSSGRPHDSPPRSNLAARDRRRRNRRSGRAPVQPGFRRPTTRTRPTADPEWMTGMPPGAWRRRGTTSCTAIKPTGRGR